MLSDPSVTILMYFVLPVWFIAGFADWICHRATSIETTSGVKESAIHALMFVEVGLILLPGLFLEINSLVIALAIAIFVIHEATALWDISYAVSERHVSPYEQMVHSFLEIVPLMAIGSVVALHWGQFLATFGYGPDVAGLALEWKHQPLPSWYLSTVMEAILVFEFIPYAEELLRCWRARPLGCSDDLGFLGFPRRGKSDSRLILEISHGLRRASR